MGTTSLSIGPGARNHAAASRSADCRKLQSGKLTAEIIRISQNAIKGGSFRKILADRAKCSLRTIDAWISRESPMGLEHVFNVLDGPDGVACLEAFWEQVPEHVRDRFLERQILERELREAEEKIRRVRRQSEDLQITMDLKRR